MYGDMENVDHLHTFQQLPTYTYAQRFHGKNMQTIFLWPLKLKSIRLYSVPRWGCDRIGGNISERVSTGSGRMVEGTIVGSTMLKCFPSACVSKCWYIPRRIQKIHWGSPQRASSYSLAKEVPSTRLVSPELCISRRITNSQTPDLINPHGSSWSQESQKQRKIRSLP